MRRPRGPRWTRALFGGLAGLGLLATAGPAAAHGYGPLQGLPLERWQFAWGIAALLLVVFFVAASSWPRPVLAAAATGRALPGALQAVATGLGVLARVVGVVVYGVVVTAGLFGSTFPAANIAPIAVFITLWIGLAFVSIVLGDVWRVLSPFATLAAAGAWVRVRRRGEDLAPAEPAPIGPWAPALAAGFLWLELAYHSATQPRLLGALALGYGVVVLAGAARWGRGWLAGNELFAVVFGLLAALAPLHREDGRVRVRWPVTGLGRLELGDAALAVLLVVIGGTVFDGWTRTTFWADLTLQRVGWGYTAVATLGLCWTIGLVALVYLGVTRLAAASVGADGDETARSFGPLLVPLTAAYVVAHSFSILVVEGQGFWFLASNPYGWGWDLFGTADAAVDQNLLALSTIVWVQVVGLVLGHGAAVLAVHDRAVRDLRGRAALRVQLILLAFLVGSAVAAVALLLGS